MTGQNEPSTKESQMRAMWERAEMRVILVGTAVIVLIFLLFMGLRFTHTDTDLIQPPNVTGKQ